MTKCCFVASHLAIAFIVIIYLVVTREAQNEVVAQDGKF